MNRIITRILALCLYPFALFGQTTALPNLYPVCVQACYVDSNTNASAQYQYGDLQAYVWASSITNVVYPLFVNYTNGANLGMPATWTAAAMPTTLYVQQTDQVQTIKVHNLDPSYWTVTVPALAAPQTSTATSGTLATSAPSASVTIPQQSTTAPVIPAQTYSCYVGKNGGTCKISIPQMTLAPVTVPSQTVPITTPTVTYKFSCTAPIVDGSVAMNNLSCTASKQ